jgi:two-component system nitrogen regulation sensor histidine kinase GlnL
MENMEMALILINCERIVQRVNIATETLFEQSRRILLGKKIEQLLDSQAIDRCLTDCLQNNAQFTLREVEMPITGSLVDMTIAPILAADDGERFVLIEINSINRISRFIKETNQLERQQSFRLMMRGLAHEIKNPLGGIRGAAQLLDRELVDQGHHELTDILIKEADRLTRLVDRVMGSREQFKLHLTNIHEVLEHVVHLVSVNSPTPPKVHRQYDPTLPEIDIDKEQMIQAVLNVIGNAIESQKSSVVPEIGIITQFERLVTINQKKQRRVLKIRIWDSGSGVPEDMREILFDPLVSGRADGSGLGLSITQEIVQRHNGVVQLEDYQGKTCFSIYLPYTSED